MFFLQNLHPISTLNLQLIKSNTVIKDFTPMNLELYRIGIDIEYWWGKLAQLPNIDVRFYFLFLDARAVLKEDCKLLWGSRKSRDNL